MNQWLGSRPGKSGPGKSSTFIRSTARKQPAIRFYSQYLLACFFMPEPVASYNVLCSMYFMLSDSIQTTDIVLFSKNRNRTRLFDNDLELEKWATTEWMDDKKHWAGKRRLFILFRVTDHFPEVWFQQEQQLLGQPPFRLSIQAAQLTLIRLYKLTVCQWY